MTPELPQRRSLTKGQRTRQRLLDAAIDRFGAHGYRATSVSQLSRDAGLTPAAAYAYFADKEAFWTAAVAADLDRLDAEVRPRAVGSDQPLYDLMAGMVFGLERHPLTRRVLLEGGADDLQLVLAHPLFAGTRSSVAAGLAARRDAGVLPIGGDPESHALAIETVMFSLIVSGVRAGLTDDLDRVWAVVELLRAAMGGPPTAVEVRNA